MPLVLPQRKLVGESFDILSFDSGPEMLLKKVQTYHSTELSPLFETNLNHI